ncbi:MAG: aldo/keto reductase [Candidatus Hydrogenedentes bacterium]|nr:aldo/keto reductase [Candidatus Hydrogenedentota bacterium]
MPNETVTRREFVQEAVATALASTVALSAAARTGGQGKVPNEVKRTRNYKPEMEYRRLGKTGLWVSAVSLGGHWKRIDKAIQAGAEIDPYEGPNQKADVEPFMKNRDAVISRCLEVGFNCIDFAGNAEAETYCNVLGKRREKVYLCYSHPKSELREPENRTAKKLLELFEAGLKRCKLEYADVWRLMALERGGRHSQADVDAMIEALNTARKKGLCRHTGLSTHDREWAKTIIETYPDTIEVLCTPYTATSKELPEDSLFDAIRKYDVGVLGIKPFASNAIFKGDGAPNGPHVEEDNERARLAIRYILSNPAITAPIPGLVSAHQVDNMVRAIKESRELDLKDVAKLDVIRKDMMAQLPDDHRWLTEWEYV